ncbi:RNA-binding domain-containing protein [Microstroma glucosiphilum]|uniref:RNA-binding domain-containing protein n=1 Tax=Pseudomicrostroma glucosiphilum TaxID=1684307 RepID=A0A316U411_9BASI|nr:RNA-binding domain-containing protein [Pseudomicrostroma glucosiphilum]PWN19113.1 RNA-binding domain-containing protein [Pseudomicrostroma glucosiphilum]
MSAPYGGQQAAASSSTSADPYAPFYYWDPAANNWAFDYNGYYATYGYPQQGGAGAAAAPASAAPYPASSSASTFQPISTATSAYTSAAGPPSSSTGPIREKKSTASAGPKDASGNPLSGTLKRGEKRKTVLKSGPEGAYEDPTLLEWNPAHKRLFVGDLGNDVNDAILARAFQKWPSFSKAKVVRRKHDEKSRGYGFVSFADPEDYLKAWKEMEGKYIGSRPCRLKAAESSVEAKEIGYRQDKILANNVKHQEWKMKHKMGGAIGGQLRRHGVGKAWGSK